MYKNILFDLDGTLTDPGLGITNSVAYSLSKLGIDVPNRESLYKFIGPPLIDSYMEFYGFNEEKADLGVKYYREYFSTKGIFENEVYPGIDNLLHSLKSVGKTLLLATSKPEVFAVRIMEHFDLIQYFDFVCGSTLDKSRNTKTDVIAYALKSADISLLDECIMIGDRKHDIIGAKYNKIKSIGVLYGYGTKDELIDSGADYITETVSSLRKLLLKEK